MIAKIEQTFSKDKLTQKELLTGTDGGGSLGVLTRQRKIRRIEVSIILSNKTVVERFYYTKDRDLIYAEVAQKIHRRNPVSSEFNQDRPVLRSKSMYYFTAGKLLYFEGKNYAGSDNVNKDGNHAKKILLESEMFLGAANSAKKQIDIEAYLKSG